jgi:hypothetical protein
MRIYFKIISLAVKKTDIRNKKIPTLSNITINLINFYKII